MSKRKLPTFSGLDARPTATCEVMPSALERWAPGVHAAAADPATTIGIYDVVGDPWGDNPVTAKKVSGILRAIGPDAAVTVNINSPGGDMFEGLAIYNLLREHRGEVTVKVVGLAASAASIIAMAGDRVEIARAGFLMIHNAWLYTAGNRHDLRAMADTLEPFDRAMADVYAARTGDTLDEVAALMDSETWIGGADAVDQGFADALLPADEVANDSKAKGQAFAARKADAMLARAGMTRTERRELIAQLKTGTHNAAGGGTPEAPETGTQNAALLAEIHALANKLKWESPS